MNSTQIIGRLVSNPEIKYVSSGNAVANFSLAVNDGYGEKKHTSFFDCVAFGKTAENIQKYFLKGNLIGVEGVLKQESWTSQEGQNRSKVVVIVKGFDFLQPKNDRSTNQNNNGGGYNNNQQAQNNQQNQQQNNNGGIVSDPWAQNNQQQSSQNFRQQQNNEDIPF